MSDNQKIIQNRSKNSGDKWGIPRWSMIHALGVSIATVNRWKNGKTMPSKLAIKQFTAFCATNARSGKLSLEDKDVTP